jgi:outer membrane protein OmpA-like peptidoglycan-associated protein
MEAFANTVEYGLSSGRLGLKLPFMQGSTGLQVDPNDGGQQDMWLAQIAKEAARREYCLEILGHTHRAGPERLNQRLSLRRAEYVKRRLEAEVPELRDRIIVAGRGADDNLVGSGTADSADELDRRMELEAIDCSTSE